MKAFQVMCAVMLGILGLAPSLRAEPGHASFENFDRCASAGGQPLTVVFFGGSLTWGANASDPQRTSYRGLMMDYLLRKYPKAPFRFVDASIGGTGSKLGLFRVDRDVLAYHPDLVFLDFTANDGCDGSDPRSLSSYEELLREIIGQGVPVVQAYFGFKSMFGAGYHPEQLLGYEQRLQLADVYRTGCGDALPYVQGKLTSGAAAIDSLWAINHGRDGAHPDDPGYRLFFEAVRDGYEQAVAEKRVCVMPPHPVAPDLYRHHTRHVLVDDSLPAGWTREQTFRTSMWFDGLSSRWMGDVAVCDVANRVEVRPLRIDFEGTLVGLFGEADQDGLGFKVSIDGKPVLYAPNAATPPNDVWPADFKKMGGRLFFWRVLSDSLTPGKHALEIDPVMPDTVSQGQLRIESVCSAGN